MRLIAVNKIMQNRIAHEVRQGATGKRTGGAGISFETSSQEARRLYLERNPEEARRHKEEDAIMDIIDEFRKAMKSVSKRRKFIPKEIYEELKFNYKIHSDLYKLKLADKILPMDLDSYEHNINKFSSKTIILTDLLQKAKDGTSDSKTADEIEKAEESINKMLMAMKKYHNNWNLLVRKNAKN